MKKIRSILMIAVMVSVFTASPLLIATVEAQTIGFAPLSYCLPPDKDIPCK